MVGGHGGNLLRVRKLIRQCRSKFPRLIKRCSPEASLEQRLIQRCSSDASWEQRWIKRVTFQGVDELISKEIVQQECKATTLELILLASTW